LPKKSDATHIPVETVGRELATQTVGLA
jgi:hypothetical protein